MEGEETIDLAGDTTPAGEAPAAEETPPGTAAAETVAAEERGAEETPPGEGAEPPAAEETPPPPKPEGLEEFHVSAQAGLRALTKNAPEFDAVLKKYPQVRDGILAAFRRDSAFREMWGTVAEAQQIREALPRGLEDLKTTFKELDEFQQTNDLFYEPGAEGKYDGHVKLAENLFQRDRTAAEAFFNRMPQLYARLMPDAYGETFGKIMGATLQRDEIPDFIANIHQLAKSIEGGEELAKMASQLYNYVRSFLPKAPGQLTPEQERFNRDKQEFAQRQNQQLRADQDKFHKDFVVSAKKLQTDTINAHPMIKRLPASIPQAKRDEIVEKIRMRIADHLGKSRSFMGELNPAYYAMDLEKVNAVTKAALAQQWLLNMYVRRILNAETPGMVSANRPASAAKPGAGGQPAPVRTAGAKTGPRKVNGIWYKGDGTPFTTAEILRGDHTKV